MRTEIAQNGLEIIFNIADTSTYNIPVICNVTKNNTAQSCSVAYYFSGSKK